MTKTFLKTFKRFAGNLLAPKPGSIARDIHNRRLCCEPLEDRRLLAVALTYNIANYVQPGSEAIATLVANGANLEFKINGTLEDTQAMSDVSSIAVIGTPDKNVLDVDYRGGDIPAPISFDGGPDTSGDSAQIEGDGSQTAAARFLSAATRSFFPAWNPSISPAWPSSRSTFQATMTSSM
jgi:hypothetical protein